MVPLGAVPLVAMLFTPVADFDIPWYMDHPAERRALIAECQNDWRLAQSWTCNNAQAAELRSTSIEELKKDQEEARANARKWDIPGDPVPKPSKKGGRDA